jgi:hypothetical protein
MNRPSGSASTRRAVGRLEGGALKQTQPHRSEQDLECPTPWPRSPSPEGFIPIQPCRRLHCRSTCSPPDAVRLSRARTSKSHASPPARRYASRAPGDPNTYRTHNRNRTSCMHLCPRLFAQGNHSKSQPAVASRRCPPSWPSHERPWPTPDVGGRNPNRRRDVCTPNGRPPAMHNPPYGARIPRAVPPHRHTYKGEH